MKVLYDHQIFEIQEYGGVSRYFFEIIQRNKDRYDVAIPVRHSRNRYVGKIRGLDASAVRRNGFSDDFMFGLEFRGKKRIYNARNRLVPAMDAQKANRDWTLRWMRDNDFDLFHPTYYDPYFLDCLKGRPYVVTVHDFLHEVFPEILRPARSHPDAQENDPFRRLCHHCRL